MITIEVDRHFLTEFMPLIALHGSLHAMSRCAGDVNRYRMTLDIPELEPGQYLCIMDRKPTGLSMRFVKAEPRA